MSDKTSEGHSLNRALRMLLSVTIVCAGEYIGLEEIDDGVWNVYFGALKLGRLLERHLRIEDAYGRLKRTATNRSGDYASLRRRRKRKGFNRTRRSRTQNL